MKAKLKCITMFLTLENRTDFLEELLLNIVLSFNDSLIDVDPADLLDTGAFEESF